MDDDLLDLALFDRFVLYPGDNYKVMTIFTFSKNYEVKWKEVIFQQRHGQKKYRREREREKQRDKSINFCE